jgi:dTDP-N-acetylfucosamine:lipid II N-acetylfucosaminyltransferase
MILHLVVDDKFIDMAFNMFERVSPGNNEFMLVTQNDDFKYIKTAPITKIAPEAFLSDKFIEKLGNYEFIIYHTLDSNKIELLKKVPQNIIILWIGWGIDYYYLTGRKLLLTKTSRLYFQLKLKEALKLGLKLSMRKIKTKMLKLILRNNGEMARIINRINYFAPVLKEDYDIVAESFGEFRPKYLDWNYGNLEYDVIGDDNIKVNGNNILVGNSATYENNHLEAYDLLKKLQLDQKKIISPLSYGAGGQLYVNKIIEQGIKIFGDNFLPLTDFLNIDEYNRIVSSCSVVVMNHVRQQAVGNIIGMMVFGAKIFLRKENPVYGFFKNNGAVIYSMEELNNENIQSAMSQENIICNKSVLKKCWGRDILIKKTRNLIEEMKHA